MSFFETLRLNYMRASYLQAQAEGKLPQWFMRQFLFWVLRLLLTLLVVFPIKFLLVVPIKLIWKYSGRKDGMECDGLTHFIRFSLFVFMYICVLGGIVYAVFNVHK